MILMQHHRLIQDTAVNGYVRALVHSRYDEARAPSQRTTLARVLRLVRNLKNFQTLLTSPVKLKCKGTSMIFDKLPFFQHQRHGRLKITKCLDGQPKPGSKTPSSRWGSVKVLGFMCSILDVNSWMLNELHHSRPKICQSRFNNAELLWMNAVKIKRILVKDMSFMEPPSIDGMVNHGIHRFV